MVNIKNLKIAAQLKICFAIVLIFVMTLGLVSFFQTKKIHEQVDFMNNHPLMTRRAIGNLKSDILSIQSDTKDLLLVHDEKEIAFNINQINTKKINAFEQIDVLYKHYIGSLSDVDSVKEEFINWNSTREETIRIFHDGKITQAFSRIRNNGIGGQQVDVLLTKIQAMDNISVSKADLVYANSNAIYIRLIWQLILLTSILLLLLILLSNLLIRNINLPIVELTTVTRRFFTGDMNARSLYYSQNEFGVLSESFNNLAGSIQTNAEIDKKVANLAEVMLGEDDGEKFFQATLSALSESTGSQIAAVYLLSKEKKSFEHFLSIGLENKAKQSFSASDLEGEFGAVISSRKVQHIKNIPQNSLFVFYTVGGKFYPREIITIPILSSNEIVAIISLATIDHYSSQSIQLIDTIFVTLRTRIEGILAFNQMKEFSKNLAYQNSELEIQKTTLAAQSGELTTQNTELEMQKRQLSEANRLKTSFLSNMSHELRTPLNSVIALSGVLNRRLAKQIPEEEYGYLEVIERNGKHLLSLINDILDISRIEAGREEVEITQFNVNSLIVEVMGTIHQQAKQKNIELKQTEDTSDLMVINDVSKLRHILQNLVSNAIKFTEKGSVEIKKQKTDKNFIITVTDTGIGIAENHMVNIFEEFRQADGSMSRRFGGSGLGLAIAKKYANLLGGTILLTSTLGKGSEFSLVLPLLYAPENRIIDKTSIATVKDPIIQKSPLIISLSRKTILMVEDSEPAIIQMKDILEENGYQLLVAHCGPEAFAVITQTIPDAMILDLMMPGMDGFEVLKKLQDSDLTARIPIIILTAKQITKEEELLLNRYPIHQIIQKGDINRSDLLRSIAEMMIPPTKGIEKVKTIPQTIIGKPIVLVVEDNPDNMITAKALLGKDYTVIEAVNGSEGIEMAEKYKPNLILMDIALPGIDGNVAFKEIRKDPRLHKIPVIALTASAMMTDRETILAQGYDGYIAKPIDEKLFTKTIKEVLYGN